LQINLNLKSSVKKLIIFFISFTCIFSCRQKAGSVKELKIKGLKVQIIKIPNGNGEIDNMNYSARLIPDKKLLEGKTDAEKLSITYKMDSCFYLQQGDRKIYASLTQPVANGVAGSFEFLLLFEIKTSDLGNYNFVY
jgi:hypothetical protein